MKKRQDKQGNHYESGQAALIIVLVITAVVTIVASTIGRTATDVRISSQTEESLQAFNAAEAGIERALLELKEDPADTDSNCKEYQTNPCPNIEHYNLIATTETDSQSRYWYEFIPYPTADATSFELGPVAQGESKTVWFTNNHITLFSPGGTSNHFHGTITVVFDPIPINNVEFQYVFDSSALCDGTGIAIYRELETISTPTKTFDGSDSRFNSCIAYVRIRPLSEDIANLTVSWSDMNFAGNFSQGILIDVRGEYLGSSQGTQKITRRIQQVRLHEQMPSFSDYALYAGGAGIVQW
ncbi:MAG: pilus assembly PilX N-terminal domain-containing protein [Pedobacter sp.]|jgi:hypothetical protein